jgi:hypothetical protein
VASGPETVDDGGGKPDEDGTTKLENLRVLGDGESVVLTWERQSDFRSGDSWREPHAALRRGGATFRSVALPVRAYACATSGFVGPSSGAEPVVAWGVADTRAFEIWGELPKVSGTGAMDTVKTPALRTRPTHRQDLTSLVVSRNVALATTYDGTCEVLCSCRGPTSHGVWVYALSGAPMATRIAVAADDMHAPDAPALAMSKEAGVAAYRMAGALHVLWLDGDGKPVSSPVRLDEGDVGAPAVAIAGRRAVLAWARRDARGEPYRLRWLVVEHGASTFAAPNVLATAESAFAPAVVTSGSELVLAWMEGDGATKGRVLAARIAVDRPASFAPVTVSSGDETNARDPELSGSVDAPVVAYGAFSKARPGGVARVATLACDP